MFKDLKIVELASVLAGPLVGTFFSELGAEVVKIENSSTDGDVTRKWKLASENENDISAYYASANFNKKVFLLNLKIEEEYKRVLEEIKTADIVISNFKQGDAEKLKVDYLSLRKVKADLVYGEITGYGKGNKRTAFDVVLQAETGFMFMNGSKESGPIKMPVALIDILAAHQLKEGLLCALIKKLKTKKGSYVSVSLFDAAVSSLVNQATNWLMAQHIPQPMGTQHPNIAPYGDLFSTKDKKHIVLAIGSDTQFQKLCKKLDLDELTSDHRFITNKSRVENREALNLLLQPNIISWEAEKLKEELLSSNVPMGIIKNMEQVFETQNAQKLILNEKIGNQELRKIKTVVFEIS